MKIPRVPFAAFLAVSLFCVAQAQSSSRSSSEKGPADLAAANFFELRNNKKVQSDSARYQKLLEAGLGFLVEHPTHTRANAVIKGLATFGFTMKQKGRALQRAAWMTRLKYEALNQRLKEGVSDETKAAIAALEAAAAGAEVREVLSVENLEVYREKIDTLAQLPGSERFLHVQEFDYVEVLKLRKTSLAEAHLRTLLDHPHKKIVEMAADHLSRIETAKQPYELKFTALDGREVNFAQLRGKVVLLYFWSATDPESVEEQDALRAVYNDYKKLKFEIVGVVCDEETERDAVAKYLKGKRIPWPQYFDGQGVENDVATMLGVRNVPAGFLFDQSGMLTVTDVRAEKLESDLKRMLGRK